MIFGQDDAAPEPGPQQQVRLDTSGMETVYANLFALAGAQDEITVYLGANSPMPGNDQPTIKISHRLMLLPQSAKRLMVALQQTVRAHEDRFGPIELPPQPRQQG